MRTHERQLADWMLRTGKVLLTLIVLAMVVRYVWMHAHAVGAVRFRAPLWLVPATLLALVPRFITVRVCQLLLRAHGFNLKYAKVIGLVYVPALGRYVPGKVWAFLAALHLYSRHDIPAKITTTCLTLSMAIGVMAATLVTIVFGLSGIAVKLVWAGVTVGAVGLVVLHPPIFYGILNSGLRLMRRHPIEVRASLRTLLHVFGLLTAAKIAFGTAFFLLIIAFAPAPWTALPAVVGLFTFAQIAGLLTLFAPAGIGVREGVLLIGLQPILGPGPAIVIAGVARLWQTFIELAMAAIGWWTLRRSEPVSRSVGTIALQHGTSDDVLRVLTTESSGSNCGSEPTCNLVE